MSGLPEQLKIIARAEGYYGHETMNIVLDALPLLLDVVEGARDYVCHEPHDPSCCADRLVTLERALARLDGGET